MKKVTAIIRSAALEQVERRLQELGVAGVTVSRASGYGAYADFTRADWLVSNARIEVFAERRRAEQIAEAIADATRRSVGAEGVIAILPVEKVIHVGPAGKG